MPFYLSPLVNVIEMDLSLFVPAVSTSIGAVAADLRWGPLGEITLLGSIEELELRHGTPTNRNYKDWFTIEKHFNEIKEFKQLYGVFPDQHQYKSLLNINIHYGGLKPLYHFLEQFPLDLEFNKKIILGEDVYASLKSNQNSNIEFYKQFHSLPIIREGFFELLADPSFSIPDYEIGLGYYLKNIKPHESMRSMQDYIFANSLLLRYYFLRGKKENVIKIGNELYLNNMLSEKVLVEIKINFF
jgi:hypothetical protein